MNPYQTRASGCKPELLAPGGSYEKARIAFLYGADAVYAGGRSHNLRIQSRNLHDEELAALAFLARSSGKRLYITLNSLMRPKDLDLLKPTLEYLREIEVSGIIVADPGALLLARTISPGLPLHLSTQASTTNHLSVRFWEEQGVRRINLARELSIDEIEAIRSRTSLEIEVFVHGSMCVSYSGRCLLSTVMTRRGANEGHCAQPCRWSYRLVEEKRPGEYFPIGEDGQGSYILNAQDLCLIEDLHRLAGVGIDAFKIEGRMKGAHYVASVVRAYRRTLDACRRSRGECGPDDISRADIHAVSHRPYTRAFMFPDDSQDAPAVAPETSLVQTHTLAGLVRQRPRLDEDPIGTTPIEDGRTPDWTHLEVRSQLRLGDQLSFLFPDGRNLEHTIHSMESLSGQILDRAHPNTRIRLPIPFPTFSMQVVRLSRRG
ncbi:MAG: U32 family peptidase [Syntrophobacteraceae bacterium]|nr:U32 family peptidase [Syntrophobacteraceae bacterium]